MTIIAILLAFALCHFVRELGRCRQNRWLHSWVELANDALGKLPGWSGVSGFLLIIAVPLVLLLLLNHLLIGLLGSTGGFLLALAVLIYSFGPRDLDTDVAAVVDQENDERRRELLEGLLGEPAPQDHDECRALAVEAVFQQALRRWFGVIFWFAVLGIAGAFLYRVIDWLVNNEYALSEEQKALFSPHAGNHGLACRAADDFVTGHCHRFRFRLHGVEKIPRRTGSWPVRGRQRFSAGRRPLRRHVRACRA